MSRASQTIGPQERQSVNQAVAAAEARTSAEIVAAVATASGRYDRPEDIIGLWTALAAMAATWALWPVDLPEPGTWDESNAAWQLLALMLAVVMGFIAGALIGARVAWLRRLFTPHNQMRDEVWSRARLTFYDRRLYRTMGSAGLLIYVSRFERMAVIIADQAVLDKIGQPAIEEMCARLTTQLRQQELIVAMCGAIEAVGERLASAFPRAAGDVNELDDSFVVLED